MTHIGIFPVKTWLRLTCALLFLYSPSLFAQPDLSTNGCGNGWGRYVIPDRIKPIGCEFKSSCDKHDVCYGSCGSFKTNVSLPQCEYLRCAPGGDLYKKPECDTIKFRRLSIAAEERRVQCDAGFMVDIVKANPGNARCTLFSGIYPFAVRVLGSNAFVGLDEYSGGIWTEDEKRKYAEAINSLFSEWSDEQILAYTKQWQKETPKVDLSRPIFFDKKKGLRNSK